MKQGPGLYRVIPHLLIQLPIRKATVNLVHDSVNSPVPVVIRLLNQFSLSVQYAVSVSIGINSQGDKTPVLSKPPQPVPYGLKHVPYVGKLMAVLHLWEVWL